MEASAQEKLQDLSTEQKHKLPSEHEDNELDAVPPQAVFRDRRVKSDSATSKSSMIVEPMSVLELPNSGACFVWTNEPLL